MVKTAEDNDIPWNKALDWISKGSGQDWEASLSQATDPTTATPAYYRAPFHAYLQGGNLCWDAAWEQELAGKAVGQRNFPGNGPGNAGEEAFRSAFEAALESLGCRVPSKPGSLVVDLGCGTGTSTRRLASRIPGPGVTFLGLDLSPHFVAVAKFLQGRAAASEVEQEVAWVEPLTADARVAFSHRDAAVTRLEPGSAALVNMDLIAHELTPEASKEIFMEAHRILEPGGELWVNEMDFNTPGFSDLRANPLLFSLIRATEPYLDMYADYQASGELIEDLFSCGFDTVRIAAATGRHFALVATKPPDGDKPQKKKRRVLDDRRFDSSGEHRIADTHLKTWESKKAR